MCCCKCCVEPTPNSSPSPDTCDSCADAASDEVCSTTTTATTTTTVSTTTTTSTTTTRSTLARLHSTAATPSPTTHQPRPQADAEFQKEDLLAAQLATLTRSQRMDLSYTVNEMILDCQFAGSNCKPRSDERHTAQHYVTARDNVYMYAHRAICYRPLPPSVCLSVTRVDQSKTVEDIGLCNFHHPSNFAG